MNVIILDELRIWQKSWENRGIILDSSLAILDQEEVPLSFLSSVLSTKKGTANERSPFYN